MSLDFCFTPLPGRVELRRVLREQTPRLDPPLRVLAEEIRTRVAAALTNPVFFTSTATK